MSDVLEKVRAAGEKAKKIISILNYLADCIRNIPSFDEENDVGPSQE